jgi:F-type H+-transporting ATPase subunit a
MYGIFDGFEIIVLFSTTFAVAAKAITFDYLHFYKCQQIVINLLQMLTIINVSGLNIAIFGIIFLIFNKTLIPNLRIISKIPQLFLELFYKFIINIIIEQAGSTPKGSLTIYPTKYFSTIFILGITILFFNIIGLIPYGLAITGLFAVTIALATIYFVAWIVIGIVVLRVSFLYLFFPAGISIGLQPLMFVIEFISFLMRPLSLAIRLFANILAGHVLLGIIANGVMTLFHNISELYDLLNVYNLIVIIKIIILIVISVIMSMIIIVPLLIFTFFIILEGGVAFLQTYVFITLVSIYLKDSLHAHGNILNPNRLTKLFFGGMQVNHYSSKKETIIKMKQ